MAEALPRDQRMAEALTAMANPSRLALLRSLRAPKTLREIEMRIDVDGEEGRAITRQNVKKHLDRLVEQGIVVVRETERAYGTTVEYLVNHQRIFALAEEFRALARLRPVEEPAVVTSAATGAHAVPLSGPCLVLVKGLDEGTTYDLTPPGPPGGWTIGRRRDAEVALDFDPYVSADNAVVEWDGARHLLRDLPGSRNGTRLNFAPITKDQPAPLRHGDLVMVGQSILSFRSS